MLLHAKELGSAAAEPVVCIHGLAQHGGIYDDLAATLAAAGRRTIAVDLRGHGRSGYEPPWSLATHVDDLLETVAALGIEDATWIAHSFGGLVLAALAARVPERVQRLALLDPGIGLPPDLAQVGVERDRLDWSFATPEGAVNALLSAETTIATPVETVAAYAADDLVRGGDGRLRFRYAAGALVVAWSEMASPPPPVAQLPTLLVRPASSTPHSREQDLRYREALGPLLKMVAVPNGHNVLWESPRETTAAIVDFLGASG